MKQMVINLGMAVVSLGMTAYFTVTSRCLLTLIALGASLFFLVRIYIEKGNREFTISQYTTICNKYQLLKGIKRDLVNAKNDIRSGGNIYHLMQEYDTTKGDIKNRLDFLRQYKFDKYFTSQEIKKIEEIKRELNLGGW